MEVKYLEEIVDDMILQHHYPGNELRSLNLALPQSISEAPAHLYVQALKSQNIYVRLVALRWFQTRAGLTKSHIRDIYVQLENEDPWIRLEAIRTIEIAKIIDKQSVLKISSLLKDESEFVRAEAAKACGHLVGNVRKTKKLKSLIGAETSKPSPLETEIIAALKEAVQDNAQSVRRKAIKSLRKLGAFNIS